MIGKTFGHFEVLERIGAGGMGEVYRARDTKLGREVAIKVLSPEMASDDDRRRRFQREAMAVAALKHPNIVTIYSVEEEDGVVFLAMELIEGQTLADVIPSHGLSLSKLLELSLPIADAVSYAHKQGITHRDLKPANIMLDAEGRPKVLDFGLAKLMETPVTSEAATMAESGSITQEGRVLGTAAYMSPEQAEGKPVDARSDIFSLGIILYEMATGERPFKGDTSISTISAILKDHPPLVSEVNNALPRHFGRVVNRCLSKDPERRYQSGLDIRNELEVLKSETSVTGMEAVSLPEPPRRRPIWLGVAGVLVLAVLVTWIRPWAGRDTGKTPDAPETPVSASTEDTIPQRTMIVVLPFENLGPPDEAYFAAGVTEEINSRLSTVADLGVISRTSARGYANTDKNIREIGQELGVDYVVEGTVRWQKNADGTGRVRVSPKLVRVSDETSLWSSQYDKELKDIFEIQDAIAGEIVGQLGMALSVSGMDSGPPTASMEAYELYLQAQQIWYAAEFVEDAEFKMVDLYSRAVALDPGFAMAMAGLSRAHSSAYHSYADRTEERLAKAREAADKALELAPDLPQAHLSLGYYYYWGRQDYEQALGEFMKMGDQVENDAEALAAIAYVWRRQGKLAGTVEYLKKASRLSPGYADLLSELGYTHFMLREHREAVEAYENGIRVSPQADGYYLDLAWVEISWHGDITAARAIMDRASSRTVPGWANTLAWMDALEGKLESALEKVLKDPRVVMDDGSLEYWPRSLVAAVFSRETKDSSRTQTLADSARVFLEARVKESPRDVRIRGALGAAYALLGRNDDAIREGKLSVDLMSLSRDHIRGAAALQGLALIYALAGEDEKAIDHIEHLLSIPWIWSVHDYRLSPTFRNLVGNPRFDALIAGST